LQNGFLVTGYSVVEIHLTKLGRSDKCSRPDSGSRERVTNSGAQAFLLLLPLSATTVLLPAVSLLQLDLKGRFPK
jgi:hypothetical protein